MSVPQQDQPTPQAVLAAAADPDPLEIHASAPAAFSWKKLVPGLLISLAAVALILRIVNPGSVLDQIKAADARWIAASAVFSMLWLVMRTFFWRVLLLGQAGFQTIFLTINEGYLLNNFLPFRLGEIGRAILLARKTGLKFWQILPSIIIERALDIGMMIVM